jgi:hypothetical protein
LTRSAASSTVAEARDGLAATRSMVSAAGAGDGGAAVGKASAVPATATLTIPSPSQTYHASSGISNIDRLVSLSVIKLR